MVNNNEITNLVTGIVQQPVCILIHTILNPINEAVKGEASTKIQHNYTIQLSNIHRLRVAEQFFMSGTGREIT